VDSAEILPRLLDIMHGLGAALGCAVCFYLAGLAVLPGRLALTRGELPGLAGAALWVALCWFGIAAGIPLPRLALGYLAGTFVLGALRHRALRSALRSAATRTTLVWVTAFVGLYLLAYLFTLPPVAESYLPPAWTGNIDLLTYVRHTQYVLRMGPSNVAGFSYINYVYFQTPGVFHLLGALALFFEQDPLRAAMPAQFAFTALIGCLVARISHDVFSLPRAAAMAIGAILISGPFFRYIAGNYFLSTLMSMPVVLFLLWTAVSYRPSKLVDAGLIARLCCAYLLLLLIYPFLLVVGLGMQAAATVLVALSEPQFAGDGRPAASPWAEAARRILRSGCASVLPLVLLVGVFFEHVKWSAEMVFALTEKDVNGWPLGFISPWAMWGVPGGTFGRGDLEIGDPQQLAAAMATFGAMAFVLIGLFHGRFRRSTPPGARALAALAAGSFAAYCAYFNQIGPSYQQWKFASYTILPLSFVIFAGGLHLLGRFAAFRSVPVPTRGYRLAIAALVAAFVGGNAVAHARRDPDLRRFSGEIRNLTEVNELPTFREMSIWSDDPADLRTWFALYYLPSKRVHLLGQNYKLDRWLFEEVSDQRPLLIPLGCEGAGHADARPVEGVGCLLFAPPSLTLGTPHSFGRTFPFIDAEGLSGRESDGRWNNRTTVRLTLSADPRRIALDRLLYVNLLLHPFLPPGVDRQRLELEWGSDRTGATSLDHSEWSTWVSLPVEGRDWEGNWVWALPIQIDLPDGRAGALVGDPAAPTVEPRPLAAQFVELSLTERPAGRVIGSGAEVTRASR
jgi:hypothetical protein